MNAITIEQTSKKKYIRNEILDGQISIWTTEIGKATSDTAIISAHGETVWINGTFPKGTYKLVFFCPHGCDLADVGLKTFWEEKVIPFEILNYNMCQDYELTKYQGKKNNIAGEDYKLIESFLGRTDSSPDIITVKNDKSLLGQMFNSGIKLSALITAVLKEGYFYKDFHCSFCRGTGPLFGDDPLHTPKIYLEQLNDSEKK